MNAPLPAVAALLRGPSGRYLLVRTHKWGGLWGVPGGKVEYGETLEAALVRELHEEVGLLPLKPHFAFVAELIEDPAFYKKAHFVSFEYLAHTDSEEVRTNDEIESFAWLSLEEALQYPINRYTHSLLEFARTLEHGHPAEESR